MPDETRARDLIERARDGDSRGFAELFEPHRQHLLSLIRHRLSPAMRQRIDPEDVLQDTFVRSVHSLSRFEWLGEESFRCWLESIAFHVTMDVIRHQGRRTALRIESDLQGDGASPSKVLRRRERRERLQNALSRLSPDHREVLEISRMEGLSISETARRMGRTESAVKNLLLRATRKLRESFGDTESLGLDDGSSRQSGGGDDQ